MNNNRFSANISLFDIIHPDSLQHCQEVFSQVMSGERVADIQATFVAKAGKAISVEGSAIPCFIEGKLVVAHAIFRDISERKLAQEALRKVHDELEMRVDKRTAELAQTNERLKQEIKECKRAEEVLRESEKIKDDVSETTLRAEIEIGLQNRDETPSAIAKAIAKKYDLPKNRVYEEILKIKDDVHVKSPFYMD
jgi:PAS domain-containing protein